MKPDFVYLPQKEAPSLAYTIGGQDKLFSIRLFLRVLFWTNLAATRPAPEMPSKKFFPLQGLISLPGRFTEGRFSPLLREDFSLIEEKETEFFSTRGEWRGLSVSPTVFP